MAETLLRKQTCPYCTHYHVTWEPEFPHGCRAYGFKTKESPATVVRKTSGLPCQMFTPKENK